VINQSLCQEDYHAQETTENNVKQRKEKPYFNVNINPYILNTSLDLIGLEARIDHLFHNTDQMDYGYGISGRAGVDYDSDTKYSWSVYLLGLYGKKANKFEISMGVNIPYTNMQYGYEQEFEFVHLGIGYRYVLNHFPFTMRIGIASTGILNAGLGFKFSYRRK
jgi:hypothetical protein